ncbi:Uncharacterized protein Rs2_38702 [Raphanus sativus]|nr:Uncharacterized protein Rs2_38702 [Raphanus sativus]
MHVIIGGGGSLGSLSLLFLFGSGRKRRLSFSPRRFFFRLRNRISHLMDGRRLILGPYCIFFGGGRRLKLLGKVFELCVEGFPYCGGGRDRSRLRFLQSKLA